MYPMIQCTEKGTAAFLRYSCLRCIKAQSNCEKTSDTPNLGAFYKITGEHFSNVSRPWTTEELSPIRGYTTISMRCEILDWTLDSKRSLWASRWVNSVNVSSRFRSLYHGYVIGTSQTPGKVLPAPWVEGRGLSPPLFLSVSQESLQRSGTKWLRYTKANLLQKQGKQIC